MPCCEKEDEHCDTCGYSIEGDFICYSPLINLTPPKDAEWTPKKVSINKDVE